MSIGASDVRDRPSIRSGSKSKITQIKFTQAVSTNKISIMKEITMIRATIPGDTPTLLDLARATNVFKPHELVALSEVLHDYHASERDQGHVCLTYEVDSAPIGFAYYAPASMTDRGWYLYWIAVDPKYQARGIGAALLARVEADIRQRNGRLILIETSSLPHYEPTRRFYRKQGYEQAGILADFYADGDDQVVFRKRLDPRETIG